MSKYIDHTGNGVPENIKDHDIVEVVFRDGTTATGLASFFDWKFDPEYEGRDIIAYSKEVSEVLK